MYDNDGGSTVVDRDLVDFARVNQACVERTHRKLNIDFQGIFGVHDEDVEDLGLAVAQQGHHAPGDVFRRPENRPHLLLLGLGPASDLECGQQFHRFCGPDPLLAHELAGRPGPDCSQAALPDKQRAGQVQRRGLATPCPQDKSQHFRV